MPTRSLELRFYAELTDLLPPARRRAFTHEVRGSPAIKDVIESLGVPHTEVDLILANGTPVDFSWQVADGARVSVYPVFEAFDIAPVSVLRPEPLRQTRFLLDVHLGRLARYLRLLGFDAELAADPDDAALVERAVAEHRILLSRDRGLLKRSAVTHGYCVRSSEPRVQVGEVLRRFDLRRAVSPFTRCLRCNGLLRKADREEVADRVPPRSLSEHRDFQACDRCRQVYWEGAHHRRLAGLVRDLVEEPSASPTAG